MIDSAPMKDTRSILSLPPEIISLIFGHISSTHVLDELPTRYQTFLPLCFICQSLLPFVQKELYRVIGFSFKIPETLKLYSRTVRDKCYLTQETECVQIVLDSREESVDQDMLQCLTTLVHEWNRVHILRIRVSVPKVLDLVMPLLTPLSKSVTHFIADAESCSNEFEDRVVPLFTFLSSSPRLRRLELYNFIFIDDTSLFMNPPYTPSSPPYKLHTLKLSNIYYRSGAPRDFTENWLIGASVDQVRGEGTLDDLELSYADNVSICGKVHKILKRLFLGLTHPNHLSISKDISFSNLQTLEVVGDSTDDLFNALLSSQESRTPQYRINSIDSSLPAHLSSISQNHPTYNVIFPCLKHITIYRYAEDLARSVHRAHPLPSLTSLISLLSPSARQLIMPSLESVTTTVTQERYRYQRGFRFYLMDSKTIESVENWWAKVDEVAAQGDKRIYTKLVWPKQTRMPTGDAAWDSDWRAWHSFHT